MLFLFKGREHLPVTWACSQALPNPFVKGGMLWYPVQRRSCESAASEEGEERCALFMRLG